MSSKKITFGILAHVDAGKTTLSEAMLYRAGEIRKPGRVDHGDSFLDDDAIERNRGITIFSRQARFTVPGEAGSMEAVLIDTPGHVDFAAEMERSLSVIDYALLVLSGSEGVQAHTRTLWKMLRERGIPAFVFVNKMDIAVRSREDMIADLREALGMNAADFTGAAGRTDAFIDEVTLFSPDMAEAVLEGEEITDGLIADAVASGEVVPCLFGSALKIEGVDELLDALRRYTREPVYGSEFGARVYKTAAGRDGERLCFIKIMGGELRVRDRVKLNSQNREGRAAGSSGARGGGSEAKVNQIRLYSGSRCESVDFAAAGTVCAVTGLQGALPGDGLGAEPPLSGAEIRPYMIYSVNWPDGIDRYRVMDDLKLLTEEDPALSAAWSRSDDGIEIRLMGQVQLEVLSEIIKERFGYEVSFDAGNVLYLETITGTYEGVGHFEPLRHYAEVHLILSSGERGSGIVLDSTVPEDELAVNWQRLIMTHLEEKEHTGTLAGFPVTDIRISLAAGRAHDKHTEGGDFREATYRAVRNALMQARRDGNMILLEPWCEYEIELPSQHVGRAMTDIRQMGGTQDGLEQLGDSSKLSGRVPASEISAYQQILAGYTSGEGRLSTSPCGYDACHDQDRVAEERGYDPERDIDNPADSVFVNHSGSDIVKWYDVPEHMHLSSALSAGRESSAYYGSGSSLDRRASGSIASRNGKSGDPREEAKRRAAAEKELRMIFERTYGQAKQTRFVERAEKDYSGGRKLTPEEEAKNEARSKEIKAKHEHKSAPAEEKPVLILADGYNLIFADKYLSELAKIDIGSARDQLIERLCNYAGYTGCELSVVFDAYKVVPGTGSEEEHNGIRVIYTQENEPADIRIGKMINSIKDRQIYAVSSDELVQQDAWAHGALRISSREFLGLLTATEEEIRSRL